jgi:hypothetical protein
VIREETPAGLVHPEWVGGRRLWIDGAMAALIHKLHFGDPVRGWEGDPRLAVYWAPPRWEVWRLEHDGQYRQVCRSLPDIPFDERLIDSLIQWDRHRAGRSLHDSIVTNNDRVAGRDKQRRDDFIAEELAPRLRHAVRGEL